ncbi:hypothetical protein HMPREF0476_1990 [Kingella kingae ATCC 23330]|uniref:Uncharacterized protein n=1 Tax=Kingella kingae ATCC 23330 TaxID=887327 RepID=F5S9V7_KINKI|nr:hypothetical protein HMPREF0476_1990 [Kingella kingae ATCC 23330]
MSKHNKVQAAFSSVFCRKSSLHFLYLKVVLAYGTAFLYCD